MAPRLFRHGELPLVLLAVLQQQPAHGYQLLASLTALFAPRYSASPGSVYPALESLVAAGLLVAHDDDGRRVYRLTPAGDDALTRRRPELLALQERLGVHLLGGGAVEQALDRLSSAVRSAAPATDPAVVVQLLDDTRERLLATTRGVTP